MDSDTFEFFACAWSICYYTEGPLIHFVTDLNFEIDWPTGVPALSLISHEIVSGWNEFLNVMV